MRKYEGDYETDMRVRIKLWNTIYVSKPFRGTMNKDQFNVPKKASYAKHFDKSKRYDVSKYFYGATVHEKYYP